MYQYQGKIKYIQPNKHAHTLYIQRKVYMPRMPIIYSYISKLVSIMTSFQGGCQLMMIIEFCGLYKIRQTKQNVQINCQML